MPKTIFIIEDEPDMQDFYEDFFVKEDYEIKVFGTAEEALTSLGKNVPDLILLDLMLPGMTGFEFSRVLKANKNYANIPIIILSARTDEFDIITGINLGCDDYITKPFSPKILLAKIKALFQKQEKSFVQESDIVIYKTLKLDNSKFEAFIDEQLIELTPGEFKLLYFLMKSKGRVYSRTQIGENIYNQIDYDCDRSIDILVGRIRKKIGIYGKNIETIYGVGYTFKED